MGRAGRVNQRARRKRRLPPAPACGAQTTADHSRPSPRSRAHRSARAGGARRARPRCAAPPPPPPAPPRPPPRHRWAPGSRRWGRGRGRGPRRGAAPTARPPAAAPRPARPPAGAGPAPVRPRPGPHPGPGPACGSRHVAWGRTLGEEGEARVWREASPRAAPRPRPSLPAGRGGGGRAGCRCGQDGRRGEERASRLSSSLRPNPQTHPPCPQQGGNSQPASQPASQAARQPGSKQARRPVGAGAPLQQLRLRLLLLRLRLELLLGCRLVRCRLPALACRLLACRPFLALRRCRCRCAAAALAAAAAAVVLAAAAVIEAQAMAEARTDGGRQLLPARPLSGGGRALARLASLLLLVVCRLPLGRRLGVGGVGERGARARGGAGRGGGRGGSRGGVAARDPGAPAGGAGGVAHQRGAGAPELLKHEGQGVVGPACRVG